MAEGVRMGIMYLEKNAQSEMIKVSGNVELIKKNRRALRYIKDNMNYSFEEDALLIYVREDEMSKCIERIKKVSEYTQCQIKYSKEVNEAIYEYLLEEEKFAEFSSEARSIRNNECNVKEFNDFIDSVSINLSNRSLYPLQLLSAYHLAFSQNACNFSVPGAGKTSVVYGAFSYLSNLPKNDKKYVENLLIISPLSAFGPWELEYEECFGKKASCTRLSGGVTPEQKRNYLYKSNPSKITLISYNSVSTVLEELIYFIRNNKMMVVIDEAHKIKNTAGGIISSSVLELAPHCASRVVLTGTPAPNGYEDLHNLFNFIWPTKRVIPFHIHQLKDMSKRDDSRVKTLLSSIEPYFIRVRKSDLNITPATEHPAVIVPMGDSQRRIYDFLEKKYMNDILESRDSKFRADLIKARLVRLMQAATNPKLLKESLTNFAEYEGFDPLVVAEDTKVITEIMQYEDIEIPAKFVKAKDIIQSIISNNGRVIVWATYVRNILEFQQYLQKNDISSKVLYGATPVSTGEDDENVVETREAIIKEFHNEDSSFKVIIANPFAVAESISLHKVCHNAIYLERTFNAAHFLQSKDRIHRYGLKEGTQTNYYYLMSQDSVDEVINDRLAEKENRLREIIESMPIPLFANVEMETGDDDIKALIEEYVRRTKKM
jgi:SNF2 family DNA or RNA helicase